MQVKINNRVIIDDELKLAIDYLAESITDKYHKKIIRRSLILNILQYTWQIIILIVIFKYAPSLLGLKLGLGGL